MAIFEFKRDLKPGNLLVNRDCHLVLADFGLARVKESRDNRPMTHHVVTRWYRPPELILNPDGMYGTAVDVWSVGCIFAELLGRKPLFPGKDQVHQLQLIFQTLGSPEKSQMGHIRNSDGRRFLRSLPYYAAKNFRDVYPNVKSKHAIELLTMFLKFVPNDRVTVLEALNHACVSSFENTNTHRDTTRKYISNTTTDILVIRRAQRNMTRVSCLRRVQSSCRSRHVTVCPEMIC